MDAIGRGAMGLAGDTLFIAQAVTNNPQTGYPYVTTLFEDDAFFTSSAPPRKLASYAGELGAVANARLVALSGSDGGVVWDRAEQRFVLLMPPTAYGYSSDFFKVVSLAGRFLAVMQLMDPNGRSDAQQVTIYDTNRLSTTPGS